MKCEVNCHMVVQGGAWKTLSAAADILERHGHHDRSVRVFTPAERGE